MKLRKPLGTAAIAVMRAVLDTSMALSDALLAVYKDVLAFRNNKPFREVSESEDALLLRAEQLRRELNEVKDAIRRAFPNAPIQAWDRCFPEVRLREEVRALQVTNASLRLQLATWGRRPNTGPRG